MGEVNFVYVRANSDDRSIWTSVVLDDEYRLGDLKAEDIVLDIGMHTGSFVARAHMAGSRHIFGFEPSKESFELAKANVGGLAFQLINAAVGRSDERAKDPLYYTGPIPQDHETSNGGAHCLAESGIEVPVVALDTILAQLPPVRLVKIDTEGMEYPILYTCNYLFKVQEFIGEWHLTHEGLQERLDLPFPATLDGMKLMFNENAFESRFYAREEDMPDPKAGYFRAVSTKGPQWPLEGPWSLGEGRVLCE